MASRRTSAHFQLPMPAALLAALLVLGVSLFCIGCGEKNAQAGKPGAVDVQVVQVEQKDVPIYGEWIGTLDGLVNADVRAQVTGYLLKQAYAEGSYVKKGQLLFQIDPRTFQAALDQAKTQLLQPQAQLSATEDTRQAEESRWPVEQILDDGTIYDKKGQVSFADRAVNQNTGAIRIAGLFRNPGNILRPGQCARIRAATTIRERALLVPQRAVSELQGNYQVAVVDSDNKASIVTVKVGERAGSMWIIENGLKPGERVVAEGVQKVRPGAQVNPKPFAAGAADMQER